MDERKYEIYFECYQGYLTSEHICFLRRAKKKPAGLQIGKKKILPPKLAIEYCSQSAYVPITQLIHKKDLLYKQAKVNPSFNFK